MEQIGTDTLDRVGKATSNEVKDYLASHGGPFYELQTRLGLLHQKSLSVGRRAVIFIALAWAVPLLLGLPQSLLLEASSGITYLVDPTVWARFLLAIGAFMLAEQQIEVQLREKLRQFLSAPIIAPTSFDTAARAVANALRRRDSRTAEAVCLLVAGVAAVVALRNLLTVDHSSWAVASSAARNAITAAGWWTLFVSIPLFWFLALRGVWRHFVWSLLLQKLARLELRLVSTHPDGRGGLAFLASYPNAYVIFVFGVSCASAASVAKHLLQEQQAVPILTISMLMALWLAVILALFAFPLSAFSKPLLTLKKATLLRLGAQATQYHRLAERKLLGSNVFAAGSAEVEQGPDVADPSKQFETTRKMSTLLLDRSAVLPVSVAALLPFVLLAATKVPLKEALSLAKKLLLL